MRARAALLVGRTWRQLRGHWPFVALACVVLPLLWIAISLAVRSGLFGLSGVPSSGQIGAYLAFIGASLGAAATLFAALLTRGHNTRERQRLRLETVIKSLDSLPPKAQKPRLAGVLSTMVLLGQERIAIRVLQPAWDEGYVDGGTATWIIGQVLAGHRPGNHTDGDRVDDAAINEAALLLSTRAHQLTDANGQCYFPGHFLRKWTTENELPTRVKYNLLFAIGKMLAHRDKSWWSPGGELPQWPTGVLLECVRDEASEVIRTAAAVLLAALHEFFSSQLASRARGGDLESILDRAEKATSIPAEYIAVANKIGRRWRAPAEEVLVPSL